MNPVDDQAARASWLVLGALPCASMDLTGFDLVLRLAAGQEVKQADALRILHSQSDRDDVQRLERLARLKARDSALLEAAAVLGADNPGAWVLAGRLALAVERFESRLWARLRSGAAFDLAPSDSAIHRAFLTGERVPKTQRRLYDLLT